MHNPDVTLTADGTFTADTLGFFERIRLENLEGQPLRIPAATQRYHFGAAPFGRKQVTVSASGEVSVSAKCAFGQDWNEARLRWSAADRKWINASDGTIRMNQVVTF